MPTIDANEYGQIITGQSKVLKNDPNDMHFGGRFLKAFGERSFFAFYFLSSLQINGSDSPSLL